MKSKWDIVVGERATTAELDEVQKGKARGVFVCAHGAGGSMSDRSMLDLSETYRSIGLHVVRFNFFYKARGSGGPDPMPRLIECFSEVVARARKETKTDSLIIGGRSMGGRAASMMAADGFDCDRLLLLAYPLHPPGQPEKLRDEHLARIKVPTLCFNGTRDSFCTPEIMKKVVSKLGKNFTMHWIEGADHGFKVPKSSGRTQSDVLEEVKSATEEWLVK